MDQTSGLLVLGGNMLIEFRGAGRVADFRLYRVFDGTWRRHR